MLAILQFDAASARLLDALLAEQRLPNLASLRDRGAWLDLDAPATQFAAGAQHSLYSGHELGEHGLFYPFQWSAPEQRARYMGDLHAPPPVWEQLAGTGSRTLAVDPYESRPPTGPSPGTQV
ncbi:MAG: alkaline phosphatase family protein, partial [Acidimicrobiia bacterium]